MSKLTSAEYRRMQHPDKQALLKQLERDPADGSQSALEDLDDVLEILGNEESGLVQAVTMLLGLAQTEGAPDTAQVAPSGTLYNGHAADEILITSRVLGIFHNGVKFRVIIPDGERDEININFVVDEFVITCKTKLEGEKYVCDTTAAELVTAFNLDSLFKDAFEAEAKGTAATAIAAEGNCTLAGGVDITGGEPGALRWDESLKRLWMSLGQSTQTVNCWHYVQLVDPNE